MSCCALLRSEDETPLSINSFNMPFLRGFFVRFGLFGIQLSELRDSWDRIHSVIFPSASLGYRRLSFCAVSIAVCLNRFIDASRAVHASFLS